MNELVVEDINLDRLNHVIDVMAEYYMGNEVLMSYLLFQFYKVREDEAKNFESELTQNQLKLYETFKLLRNVNTISKSGKRKILSVCLWQFARICVWLSLSLQQLIMTFID